MYNQINPHYDNDGIWERKQEYYQQVLNPNRKRISPHKAIKFQPIPQPGNFLNHSKLSQVSSSMVNNNQFPTQNNQSYNQSNHFQPTNDRVSQSHNFPNVNISQINPRPQLQKPPLHSSVSQSLKQTDPEKYKLLQERAQLYKKLQLVTVGIPINENQGDLLFSSNFLMPGEKWQKMTELKQQEKRIKKLTAEMLENEKMISKIALSKQRLAERVDRIRKIDKEIFSHLDEDKNIEIENYLRIAKNLLAQGQTQDKIAAVLKRILY